MFVLNFNHIQITEKREEEQLLLNKLRGVIDHFGDSFLFQVCILSNFTEVPSSLIAIYIYHHNHLNVLTMQTNSRNARKANTSIIIISSPVFEIK